MEDTNKEVLWAMEQSMIDHGFRNVRKNAEYGGITFQLMGEAKAGLVRQNILASFVPVLDEKEATRIGEDFLRIDKASKSFWIGKIFTLCVFTDKVEGDAAIRLVQMIRKNGMNASNILRGGGGGIFIFDISKVEVAGSFYPRAVGEKILAEVVGEALAQYEPEEPDESEAQVRE